MKQILLVHGRGPKPDHTSLFGLWQAGIRTGLSRDFPKLIPALDDAEIDLFYYGDVTAQYKNADYQGPVDLKDRLEALAALQKLKTTSDFRRRHYETLPGKSPLKEFMVDVGSSLGLGGVIDGRLLPELAHYCRDDQPWVSELQARILQWLASACAKGGEVMLIGHCLGSVLAYDALWSLTHVESQSVAIDTFITLGSPIAARSVQKSIRGGDEEIGRKFPSNIRHWYNLAAEDDYVCHDKTVVDEFSEMLRLNLVDLIQDHTIYNLTVRNEQSNPHSSLGYLVHPRTAALIAGWLDR